MSERSKSYREGLLNRLRDNAEAEEYLQAALEDSQGAFLVALKNVLDAHKVAKVARSSQVSREHLYQALTPDGNPTISTLERVLSAVGLRLTIKQGRSGEKQPGRIVKQAWQGSWSLSKPLKKEVAVYTTGGRTIACYGVGASNGNSTASRVQQPAGRASIRRSALASRLEPCYEMAY